MLAVVEHIGSVAVPHQPDPRDLDPRDLEPRDWASCDADLGRLDLRGAVGEAGWARLPPALRRRFAPGHGAATYAGSLDAERSPVGWLFALAAGLLGRPLPSRAGRNIPAEVRVRPEGAGVTWERWLLQPGRAAERVRSTKLPGPPGCGPGTVLERTCGPLGLGLGMLLDVSEERGALVFRSRGYALLAGRLRLRLPGLLTPGRCTVEHRAEGPGRFRFTLTMDHPVWGRTFRQTGLFTDPNDPELERKPL